MSSSRQNSRSKYSSGRCPTCGSKRVVSVCEDVVLTIKGVRHLFKAVPHESCAECGERIFGVEASQRFDRAIVARRRRRRAA
jgi:YgiT-type zinc finger domain-containing protein